MSLRPTRRRRRDHVPPGTAACVGLGVGLVLATLVVIALQSPDGLPGRGYTELTAVVPDAGNLQPHNEVRVRGIRLGQVIEVRPQGRRAAVELKLDPGTGTLPADSTVAVRARGLLGQRYLEIVPGESPKALADGATLRGGDRSLTSGVPDVLDTFDAETRGGLRATLRGVAEGLAARGQGINDGVRVLPEGQADSRRFIDAILERGEAATSLVPSLDVAADTVDASSDDLAGMLEPASRAVRPFGDERERVRETLDELPPTLAAAAPALRDGRRVLASARSLARSVDRTLPTAPGALRETSLLLSTAETPLRRAANLLRSARSAIPPTLALTGDLRPQLGPVGEALDHVGEIVRTVGPYGCDLVNLGDNWHSALGWGQDAGFDFGPLHNFRITVMSGPDAMVGVGPALTPEPLIHKDTYPAACKYSPGGEYAADILPVVIGDPP